MHPITPGCHTGPSMLQALAQHYWLLGALGMSQVLHHPNPKAPGAWGMGRPRSPDLHQPASQQPPGLHGNWDSQNKPGRGQHVMASLWGQVGQSPSVQGLGSQSVTQEHPQDWASSSLVWLPAAAAPRNAKGGFGTRRTRQG